MKKLFITIVLEFKNIKLMYNDLPVMQKAELHKSILFGLLVNGIYGILHLQFVDVILVAVVLYSTLKIIKNKE